ncbi:Ribosome association toxin RatA [hydrothermal vent metagenome]|uniref:Ribosome association toxin RatA n=1 Tax=hydrothermal vent metagenome TaxID=652676 RepID=A0A3B1B9N9_9ZZZZ
MTVIHKSALVPFSAARMYDVINDVEAYPDFLPWCHSSQVIAQTEQEQCGELEVARAGIRQKFTTVNRLFPHHKIEIRLKEGPFSKLEGAWMLTELRADACKVELVLEFEFAGKLINSAFGRVFSQIAASLVDAFVKRMNDLYR